MTERRKEVGACGNHCAGCQDFLVLEKNDDALRKHVAASLTKEIGREVLPQDVGCEGCWGNIHNAIAASLACKIRQCVESKNYATCAECPDFACTTYLKQFAENSDQAQNIKASKQVGMDKWIAQPAASGYRPPAAGSA